MPAHPSDPAQSGAAEDVVTARNRPRRAAVAVRIRGRVSHTETRSSATKVRGDPSATARTAMHSLTEGEKKKAKKGNL